MKKIALYLVGLCAVLAAEATVPQGYYNSLKGKTGEDLKDAVHAMTVNHTVLSYNSLWYYYVETDARPDNPNQVWDMYSNNTYYFSSTRGNAVSGMNKEHSFPKSWWGGSKNAAYSDLHHLIPTDANANSARSNWPFGEVASSDWDNGLSKRGTPRSGQGGGASRVFEPADEYKGDFARIYFYMVSCYQELNWKTTYMLTNSDWRTLNQWSIDLLLRWAREDPVSQKEITRNDAIARYQNNRNPFVDNPDLMEYIWGTMVGTAWDGSGTVNPDPDPANNMNVSSLLWEIRRVRRCELMFDGYRYWDLIRWHQLDKLDTEKYPNIILGANVANDASDAVKDLQLVGNYIDGSHGMTRTYDKKHYFYPVPTGQILYNPQLTQNPGW